MAIRVDASPAIGIGHLMRCLTLADAARASGGNVSFLTAPLPDAWGATVRQRGHALVEAPVNVDSGGAADIRWASGHLARESPQWLVVDHYRIGADWESAVAPPGCRVMVIDDLADRRHACDVLLDQNLIPEQHARHHALVPAGCRLLFGPRYALLRPEYAERRTAVARESREIRRVLVFFGGSDPARLTERALGALTDPACAAWHVDVVCGADPDRRAAIETLARLRGRTTVWGPRDHLADLMAGADVSLGAGGSTTWERMCLGVTSLVVTVADNQVPLAAALAQDNLIVLLGPEERVTQEDMRRALLSLAAGQGWPDVPRAMSLSDGRGVQRVMAVLQSDVHAGKD